MLLATLPTAPLLLTQLATSCCHSLVQPPRGSTVSSICIQQALAEFRTRTCVLQARVAACARLELVVAQPCTGDTSRSATSTSDASRAWVG